LILASSLFAAYLLVLKPTSDNYATIYLLDSNKKAADYPETLVAGVNSTFSVYVNVENHLGETINAVVQVKIAADGNTNFPLNVEPTQTITDTIEDGATSQNIATVTLDSPGSYLVAFELWTANANGICRIRAS
jgi:uncharacterized membrane protein